MGSFRLSLRCLRLSRAIDYLCAFLVGAVAAALFCILAGALPLMVQP